MSYSKFAYRSSIQIHCGHSTTVKSDKVLEMEKLQFHHLEPIQFPLIQRFYKQFYPTSKPKRNEKALIVRAADTLNIVACVRFRQVDPHYQLLTGMAVSTEQRGQGIGKALLAYCQQNILDNKCYCFAYSHLTDFYKAHGFVPLEAGQLPLSIKVLYHRYTNSGKSLVAMQYL
ncbi:GNAT family N-acetyltransferase [Vibrio salinus]|uniref:GNAT family N-acetyltransferase n=1 Tax=Vibrio salinus TaxID=2899784 RepID=UPI001E3A1C45|nr:GNAT family N-acetyltransferase [Vibrio salinus]MCE0493515.1 GNAT family N-acetyltransferase [Vibrio salinus]